MSTQNTTLFSKDPVQYDLFSEPSQAVSLLEILQAFYALPVILEKRYGEPLREARRRWETIVRQLGLHNAAVFLQSLERRSPSASSYPASGRYGGP